MNNTKKNNVSFIEELIGQLYHVFSDTYGSTTFTCHEDEVEAENKANLEACEIFDEAGIEEHDADYLERVDSIYSSDDVDTMLEVVSTRCEVVSDMAEGVISQIVELSQHGIYTKKDISENPLYGDVMAEINDLYRDLRFPEEFDPDENKRTTTGNQLDPFWDAGNIGEWDEDEKEVVENAQGQLNCVYAGLGLYGNGGISHYYRTAEWADFVQQAEDIINEYHADGAYGNLCE